MCKNYKSIFMFGGQGFQYYQMGKELFDHNEIFRNSMLYLDSLMQLRTQQSFLEIIFKEGMKYEDLDDIRFSHPALYAVQVSLTKVLISQGILPDILLGYSLGEYIAAAIAGVFTVEDGMNLVIQQSQFLYNSDLRGGMLAVLETKGKLIETRLLNEVEIGVLNYDGCVTLSGYNVHLAELEPKLRTRGIYTEWLPVKFPFHSTFINDFRQECLEMAKDISFKSPAITCYSCATGGALLQYNASHLWNVVHHPVVFPETVMKLKQAHDYQPVFFDLSPTGSLGAFLKFLPGYAPAILTGMNRFGGDLKTLNLLYNKIHDLKTVLS